MNTWFTSDTHFGHNGIIPHSGRPWPSAIEMDVDLIKIWNKIVGPEDEVWHLGDFSFHRSDWRPDAAIVEQLNGKINIIAGNHDNVGFLRKCKFASVREGIVERTFDHEGKKHFIVMCHYPLREWNGFYYDAIHLYGHVHDTLPNFYRSMDVGVDTNDFMPYSLKQIVKKMDGIKNEHSNRKLPRNVVVS